MNCNNAEKGKKSAMLSGLPFLWFFYRFHVFSTIFNYAVAIMFVEQLFIYFFSLLNRKFNKDSKNALKTVISYSKLFSKPRDVCH